MIADKQTLSLYIDRDDVQYTEDAVSSGNDVWTGYAVGYIPASMIANSHMYSGAQYLFITENENGVLQSSIQKSDEENVVNRGVPFAYAVNAPTASTTGLYSGQLDTGGGFGSCTYESYLTSNTTDMNADLTSPVANLIAMLDVDNVVNSDMMDDTSATLYMIFQSVLFLSNDDGSQATPSDMGSNFSSFNYVISFRGQDLLNALNGEGADITINFNVLYPGTTSYRTVSKTFSFSEWSNSDGLLFKVDYNSEFDCFERYTFSCIGMCVESNIRYSSTTGIHGAYIAGTTFPFNSKFRQPPAIGAKYRQYSGAIQSSVAVPSGTTVQGSLYQPAVSEYSRYKTSTAFVNTDPVNMANNSTLNDAFLRNEGSYVLAKSTSVYSVMFQGYTHTDLKILVCTCSPIYCFTVDGVRGYYVPEFTDSYEITGNIIPYENAQDWQKNISSDTNAFDVESIPESGGDDDDSDIEEEGDNITMSHPHVPACTGFITQYVLSPTNLASLGSALWASLDSENFWQNVVWASFFETGSFDIRGLLDYFIDLKFYPFDIAYYASSYSSTRSTNLFIGRGTVALKLSGGNLGILNQFTEYIDAGSVSIPSDYSDFRDYNSTTITCFVPFCGSVQLNPGDVINSTLSLVYGVDYSTGNCTAYIISSKDGHTYPLTSIQGKLGMSVPMSATNAGTLAANISKQVATITTALLAPEMLEATSMGEAMTGVGAIAGNQAVDIANRTPTTGSVVGGGSGFDACVNPDWAYVQIRRPLYSQPNNYSSTVGNRYGKQAVLSSVSGFTKCENVDVSGLMCTQEEKYEIKRLLESGVYL